MAVGFGTRMLNSPMVITWPNSDGTVTVSQREATAHVMPTVVANPTDKATFVAENSVVRRYRFRLMTFDLVDSFYISVAGHERYHNRLHLSTPKHISGRGSDDLVILN